MLNCTDLECILHHHHYYAHLHHMQHHLQNAQDQGMGTDGSTTVSVDYSNDTNSSLAGTHLDAPDDGAFMIFGVLIAMAMVALIIILLALTINKLRKREEHSNSVHPADAALPPPAPEPVAFMQPSIWQFPPPLPPPYVYTADQNTLMQPIGNERASFRALRKNIGGKWRRLVKRKPEQEVYTIPPELKPQLKEIYVY